MNEGQQSSPDHYDRLVKAMRELPPITPVEPVKMTRAQWEMLGPTCPPARDSGYLGVPVEFIESDEVEPIEAPDEWIPGW